jgi:hypothetical protein
LDLGDHREIPGVPITPSAKFDANRDSFDCALKVGGVFCLATHYWELDASSSNAGDPGVGEQLRILAQRAISDPRVVWSSVGDIVSKCATAI